MNLIVTFIGSLINNMFHRLITISMIKNNKATALISQLIATITFVIIINNDFSKENIINAVVIGVGNVIGLWLILIKKDDDKIKQFTITVGLLSNAKTLADNLRDEGFHIKTSEAYINKNKTLDITTYTNNKIEKNKLYSLIPKDSIVAIKQINSINTWR